MAMCEELGSATGVQNQYDDMKDLHKFVEFDYRLVFVIVVKQKPRGIMRSRSTSISHIDSSEIACSPRSRN